MSEWLRTRYTGKQINRMHWLQEMQCTGRKDIEANGWTTNCYCIGHLGFYRLWAFRPDVARVATGLCLDTEIGAPVEAIEVQKITAAWRRLARQVQQHCEVWISHNGRRVV